MDALLQSLNLQSLVQYSSAILAVIAGICVLTSIITQFTKGIGFLDKIPTKFQVLVLSLVITLLVFFSAASYFKFTVLWYYVVAAVFMGIVIAYITTNGWDELAALWHRFFPKSTTTTNS